MEYVEHAEPRPEPLSIARCRELLGEDAESMTDDDIEDILRHAETMACVVVEMYREQCRASDFRVETVPRKRSFARAREWIHAASHGRRGDLHSRQHEGADRESEPGAQLRACEEYCRRQGYEVSIGCTEKARAPSPRIAASFRTCSRSAG